MTLGQNILGTEAKSITSVTIVGILSMNSFMATCWSARLVECWCGKGKFLIRLTIFAKNFRDKHWIRQPWQLFTTAVFDEDENALVCLGPGTAPAVFGWRFYNLPLLPVGSNNIGKIDLHVPEHGTREPFVLLSVPTSWIEFSFCSVLVFEDVPPMHEFELLLSSQARKWSLVDWAFDKFIWLGDDS